MGLWEGGLPANNFEFLKTEQDIRKKSFAPYHILSLIHSYKIASGTNTDELFIFLMLILTLEPPYCILMDLTSSRVTGARSLCSHNNVVD